MLLVPVVLLVLALLVRKPLEGIEPLAGILSFFDHAEEGEFSYAHLFPHWLLIGFFTFFWGLACLGGLAGVVRYWRAMRAADEAAGAYAPVLGIVPSFVRALTAIFRHDRFGKCISSAPRRLAHLGAFYGFVALFLVSVWAVIALYMINPLIPGHESDLHYPFAPWNPWKILANVGAVVLIAGCVKAIMDRKARQEETGASSTFDWIFVYLLLAVGVSGLLTEILRWAVSPMEDATSLHYVAYAIYFVHLVVVFGLLVYLPYSKFAHVLYRTVAMAYAEHSGRTEASNEPKKGELYGPVG
jgi:quinone-modifying oxidoreductase subunit QmoC